MIDNPDRTPPADVCAVLRAHAEQRWLTREVAPLLSELGRAGSMADEERGPALAYLEAVWIEACRRALQTDAALARLASPGEAKGALHAQACRYHRAVHALRLGLVDRVAAVIATAEIGLSGEPTADVLSREAARHEADCIRSGRWRPGLTYSRIRRTPTAR
jgi:hypothetical protein